MPEYASKGHRLLAQYMALQEADSAWLARMMRAYAGPHKERDIHKGQAPYKTAKRVVRGGRPSRVTAELIQSITGGAVAAADFDAPDTEDTP
jgi:hypothetical protein